MTLHKNRLDFVPDKYLQVNLIFGSNFMNLHLKLDMYGLSTQVCSSLAGKFETGLKQLVMEEHSSLFCCSIGDQRKGIYKIDNGR